MSPGPNSFSWTVPSGETIVVMMCPSMTYAHSAAIPCQCSSRRPPGCRRIDTPAILCEMGKLLTLTSLAVPPLPFHWELLFSRLNLNGGSGGDFCLVAPFPTGGGAPPPCPPCPPGRHDGPRRQPGRRRRKRRGRQQAPTRH